MIVYLVSALSALISKCLTGLFGYSGASTPPMFGDYEAQRHWMEITYHLPLKEWYFDTLNNNLTYWGLDYPPLTAYHSYLMGALAHKINPNFVQLGESKGHESLEHKFFMRLSVLVCDLLLYTSGLCVYIRTINKLRKKKLFQLNVTQNRCLFLILLYPGLILVDHGHFQYNCVCLGLTVLSVVCLLKDKFILASILYCLSFSYKQMALYYSLPYFFYFIGKFFTESKVSFAKAFKNLLKIAFSVVLTVLLVWFPFITNITQIKQVMNRVFPLYRGIFEDKVSNVWCIVNIFFKLRVIENEKMALLCTNLVILACLPSCINLVYGMGKDRFILSLINCSLSFFLFSFQVHEKTILLVALPVLLLIPYKPVHSCWFLIISTFSMSPLLIKDQLMVPLLIFQLIYTLLAVKYYDFFDISSLLKELPTVFMKISKVIYSFFILSLFGFLVIFVLSIFCQPPDKYPDFFPLLTSVYSAVHFIYFYVYFNYCQLSLPFVKHQVKYKRK